jgi:hypothetical protein
VPLVDGAAVALVRAKVPERVRVEDKDGGEEVKPAPGVTALNWGK